MQKKAILLFAIGLLSMIPWAAFLLALAVYFDVYFLPRGPIKVLIVVAVVAIPGLLIGSWALKIPKVVYMKCFQCKWSQAFVFDNRQ